MNNLKQSNCVKRSVYIIICVAIAIFAVYSYVHINLKPNSLSGVYSQGIEPDSNNLYFSFQTKDNTYLIKNCQQEVVEKGTFKKISSQNIYDVYQLNSDVDNTSYVVNSKKKITVLGSNGVSCDIKFVGDTPLID